ncbi:MAG: hypothetical protein M3Z19_17715 [Chloroflexota bacterium]|nr:hypothetical protein [Chloroflexota bacterium]
MAQVTPQQAIRGDIDRQIAIAIGNWEDVAEVATEWIEMSEEEQFLYFIDWPVAEIRTQRLLTMESILPADDERAAKLRTLRILVERNRPLLERMRSGPITSWD